MSQKDPKNNVQLLFCFVMYFSPIYVCVQVKGYTCIHHLQ